MQRLEEIYAVAFPFVASAISTDVSIDLRLEIT